MRGFLAVLTAAALLGPAAVAVAQDAPAPASAAPTGASESVDVKHDQGTVRTVDAQNGKLIADMPDGPVTYDISQAQLIDLSGKPAGVASHGVQAGDRVRITYVVNNGARASEVRLVK